MLKIPAHSRTTLFGTLSCQVIPKCVGDNAYGMASHNSIPPPILSATFTVNIPSITLLLYYKSVSNSLYNRHALFPATGHSALFWGIHSAYTLSEAATLPSHWNSSTTERANPRPQLYPPLSSKQSSKQDNQHLDKHLKLPMKCWGGGEEKRVILAR